MLFSWQSSTVKYACRIVMKVWQSQWSIRWQQLSYQPPGAIPRQWIGMPCLPSAASLLTTNWWHLWLFDMFNWLLYSYGHLGGGDGDKKYEMRRKKFSYTFTEVGILPVFATLHIHSVKKTYSSKSFTTWNSQWCCRSGIGPATSRFPTQHSN